jgi:hypothetical protein
MSGTASVSLNFVKHTIANTKSSTSQLSGFEKLIENLGNTQV